MNNILAHRLSIVVPMYNEVDNVEPFRDGRAQALDKYPHPWELIIVNDGSRDGTQQALDEQSPPARPSRATHPPVAQFPSDRGHAGRH